MLRLGDILNIIHRRSSSFINGRADWTVFVNGTIDSFDSSDKASSECLETAVIGGACSARVAIRCHEELGVGMDIDVELNTATCLEGVDLSEQGFVLYRVACGKTFVCLVARICGGSTCNSPLERPVSIDVTTDARA